MVTLAVNELRVPGRLEGLTLNVCAGELVGLIGPNGAGKSTLLSCMAGLSIGQAQALATVSLSGVPLTRVPPQARARAVGFMPQQTDAAWDLRAEDVVALGRLPWGDIDAAHPAVETAMRQTDVWSLRTRRVRTLSGGEWARVCLARVLAGEPALILADEPTSHLDLLHQQEVMRVIRAHAQGGRAAVVALHDLGAAARYCDRLVLLKAGRLVAAGTPATVLQNDLLQSVYGVRVHVDLQADPPVVLPAG
ncbi:ATP-binding cassette domain-containing protein [Aquabacterium fontiphilum]|jgi:iron complex transport system ATP-binding protein|uniref:ABC transporter ATP-binding protein n=1 Tax=Aquabacterium fontiphilum TaxID=450365 RepID=UPI0013783FA4|nr:ABC transporter ATP-binding protein [Aquabacterium fontiphilum]NBD22188.1 ATP-binding cassette domain-containing protein [Aquabacterium fontiphilum]